MFRLFTIFHVNLFLLTFAASRFVINSSVSALSILQSTFYQNHGGSDSIFEIITEPSVKSSDLLTRF